MIRSLLSGAAALLAVAPAFAHAGFLVPVTDGPDADGKVLLHATFSDAFPQMEIGLTSEAWVIVTPEGERKDFDRMAERPAASLEERGSQPGSYVSSKLLCCLYYTKQPYYRSCG